MVKVKYKTGYKFNKLTVLGYLGRNGSKDNHSYYRCQCDCGNLVDVLTQHIQVQKSCGCALIPKKEVDDPNTKEFLVNKILECENNERIIGIGRIHAMDDYIQNCRVNNRNINFSDIANNDVEYKNFTSWFIDTINPFQIIKSKDGNFTISLYQNNFDYDILNNSGYDYENVFKKYIHKNLYVLESSLKYDSTDGIFCVYCNDIQKAENLIYELSCLYKNKDKMLELIDDIKMEYKVKI